MNPPVALQYMGFVQNAGASQWITQLSVNYDARSPSLGVH